MAYAKSQSLTKETDIIIIQQRVAKGKPPTFRVVKLIITNLRLKCPRCDAYESGQRALCRHLRMHRNPRRCPYCGHEAQTEQNLVKHVRRHTGERPYACPSAACLWAFKQKGDLLQHIRRGKHGDASKNHRKPPSDKMIAGATLPVLVAANASDIAQLIQNKTLPSDAQIVEEVKVESPATASSDFRGIVTVPIARCLKSHRLADAPPLEGSESEYKLSVDDSLFTCAAPKCLNSFTSERRLQQHVAECHASGFYQCPFCARAFKKKATACKHVRGKHNGSDEDVGGGVPFTTLWRVAQIKAKLTNCRIRFPQPICPVSKSAPKRKRTEVETESDTTESADGSQPPPKRQATKRPIALVFSIPPVRGRSHEPKPAAGSALRTESSKELFERRLRLNQEFVDKLDSVRLSEDRPQLAHAMFGRSEACVQPSRSHRMAASLPPLSGRRLATCSWCRNQASEMSLCGGCRLVHYCSVDCQRCDYSRHLAFCSVHLAEERQRQL